MSTVVLDIYVNSLTDWLIDLNYETLSDIRLPSTVYSTLMKALLNFRNNCQNWIFLLVFKMVGVKGVGCCVGCFSQVYLVYILD